MILVTVVLEVEDSVIENREPTEQERKTQATSYFKCDRCGGLLFHALERKPLILIGGEKHMAYNDESDQVTVAMKICWKCKKLSLLI